MEDFPRGGSNVLSPSDIKKIRETAVKDVLFGTEKTEKSRKTLKKKKKPKGKEKTQSSKLVKDASEELVTRSRLQSLHYKNLSEKQLLLGSVKEINNKYVIVNLPNSLTGYVENQLQLGSDHDSDDDMDYEEDSDENPADEGKIKKLGESLHQGCFVPLIITEVNLDNQSFKKVKMSIDPPDVNSGLSANHCLPGMVLWGSISEVEDHGYSVSFGIKDVTGFLPKNQAPESLKLHQLLWLCVTKVSGNGRLLTVTNKKEETQKAVVKDEGKLAFYAIRPGMCFNAKISKVQNNGVYLEFSRFEGTVDFLHLPSNGIEGSEKLKKNQKVKARALHINPFTKVVGLSLLESIVHFEDDEANEDELLGLVKTCEIRNNTSRLLLSFDDNIRATVIAGTLRGDDQDKEKKYKVGKKKKGRLVGYNSMDRLFIVSFDKSVIEQPFLRYQELKLGQTVEGTIICLEQFGMLVKIADRIRGLVPTLHLADITLKYPEKKLVEDKTVQCKVLNIAPDKKKLLLTHKKTMVHSEHSLLTSYDEAKEGTVAHGFVAAVKKHGLIVKFYGDVCGFIKRSDLGTLKSEDLQTNFKKGQVVKCVVLSSDAENKRLNLKLMVGKGKSHDSKSYGFGEKVDGKMVRKERNGFWIQPAGTEEQEWLPEYYVADGDASGNALKMCLRGIPQGTKIGKLMFIGKDKQNRNIFTMKKSLLAALHKSLTFADLTVGQTAVVVITHIVPYGVFVELAPGLTGLIPIAHLSDGFLSDLSSQFFVGQSVLAKITEIDQEKKRFLMTMKSSELKREVEEGHLDYYRGIKLLEYYMKEKQHVFALSKHLPDNSESAFFVTAGSLIGSLQAVKVLKALTDGLTVETDDGTVGEVPKQLAHGLNTEVGEMLDCFVVDVDLAQKKFIGIADPDVIDSRRVAKEAKLVVGRETDGLVCWLTGSYVVAVLPDFGHVIGYLPAKENMNDISKASSRCAVGQKILLRISRITHGYVLLECVNDPNKTTFEIGDIIETNINSIHDIQLNVGIKGKKIHGRIHITECWDKAEDGERPFSQHALGDALRARVIGFRDLKTHKYLPISHQSATKSLLELSIRPSILACEKDKIPNPKSAQEFNVGDTVTAYVQMLSHNDVIMTVTPRVTGILPMLMSSNQQRVLLKAKKHFQPGEAYTCTVTKHLEKEGHLELSRIGSAEDVVKKGNIVLGKVVKVFTDHGLLVEIPYHKCGFVHITDLSDSYKEKPLDEFSIGNFVRVYILSIKEKERINLSMRESRLCPQDTKTPQDREIKSLDDVKEGDVLRGYVKSSANVGVFASLSPTIIGRVQIKDLSQFFVKDWKPFFPTGRLLTFKIKSINPTNNRIELSCRGADTGVPDPVPKPKRKRKDSLSLGGKRAKYELDSDGDEKHRDEHTESDNDDEDEIQVDTTESTPSLNLSSAFSWTTETGANEEKQEDGEEIVDKSTSKASKRQKRAQVKAEEELIYKAEMALLDTERGPENADDFDRLVLSSPDSSILWIQYMAFHLHSAEIEKARSVVHRALKAISFREEQEKLNIWVAWMNMENMYGTQETLNQVFQDAIQRNDAKKVYIQLSNIYIRTKKFEQAEKLYETMLKRFSISKKVWIAYAAFLMKTGKTENARKLLDKAIKAVQKRKHVEIILKFATMEFKDGEPERGKTMFESLVKSYPRRTDIWSVYIDMLLKLGEYDNARHVFDRATALTLSSKKMKSLFKKYLDFEKKHGNPSNVEAVKRKAFEYVENRMVEE